MKTKLVYAIGCIVMACPIFAKTPSAVGDLLARDLVGAGPVGHVGIATAPTYIMRPIFVLEAMNTAPHIQQNTIENFKSRSNFWGSKGGLVSPRSLESAVIANRIVNQYYACPEYTITWRWKEGQIDTKNTPLSCGQFRCDTLVNYAYAFSPWYSLPTYDTVWTTPLAIFNYFPVNTDLLIPERYKNQSTSLEPNKRYDTISSINENNLDDLNSQDFYQLLQNSPNISKQQIIYLWKLFTSNKVDNNVKILFYDFISFENPDYLTDEIIEEAKNKQGELRHKLLITLQSIYQKKLINDNKQRKNEIISYFKELQLQKLNKSDSGIVYRGLATLAPEYLETKKANLTNMDKIHVSVLSMKSNRANEVNYVKDIINNLDNPDDNLVVTATYQYLTRLLINSNLNIFSSEGKLLFREHLARKKMINHSQFLLYTSAYIEFKAALNASTPDEISALAYDYIQTLTPDIQQATLNGLTDFTKRKLNINS